MIIYYAVIAPDYPCKTYRTDKLAVTAAKKFAKANSVAAEVRELALWSQSYTTIATIASTGKVIKR